MSTKKLQLGTKLEFTEMFENNIDECCSQCNKGIILRMGIRHEEIGYQCLFCGFYIRFEFLPRSDDGLSEISRIVKRKGYGVARYGSLSIDGKIQIFHEPNPFNDIIDIINYRNYQDGGCLSISMWFDVEKRCLLILNG